MNKHRIHGMTTTTCVHKAITILQKYHSHHVKANYFLYSTPKYMVVTSISKVWYLGESNTQLYEVRHQLEVHMIGRTYFQLLSSKSNQIDLMISYHLALRLLDRRSNPFILNQSSNLSMSSHWLLLVLRLYNNCTFSSRYFTSHEQSTLKTSTEIKVSVLNSSWSGLYPIYSLDNVIY